MPPHLKHVTTVPCNLSFFTALVCDCYSFSDSNVSQGSVATHMRCDKNFAANLLENLTVKVFCKTGWELTELLTWVWCLPFLEHGVYSTLFVLYDIVCNFIQLQSCKTNIIWLILFLLVRHSLCFCLYYSSDSGKETVAETISEIIA